MVERVIISGSEDTAAQAAHEQAMIAKVDAKTAELAKVGEGQPVEQTSERPTWLPEKFKSPEDMARAYSELEQKFTKDNQGEQKNQEQTPPVVEKTDAAPNQQEATDVLAKAGLSMGDFEKEVAETGVLSAESYTKLEAAGFPKSMVDAYVAGQTALAEKAQAEVFGSVGGKENFDKAVAWAKTALTPAEIAAYNKAIDGSPDQTKLAVQGLYARFTEANGSEPQLISGSPAGSGDSFQSWAQVTAAMKTAQYKTDPAFRKSVQDRIARSSVL